MTVHSLVLFENGSYTELSKALDISVHNTILSPDTHHLVEDNYITFFYPDHLDKEVIYDYTRFHGFHLIEGWELTEEQHHHEEISRSAIAFDEWIKPETMNGYKMFRIHYWTEEPTHWEINPKTDLFVFSNDALELLTKSN